MNNPNQPNFVQILPDMNMNQFSNVNFEEGAAPFMNFPNNMQGANPMFVENFLKNNMNNNPHGNLMQNKDIFAMNFVIFIKNFSINFSCRTKIILK